MDSLKIFLNFLPNLATCICVVFIITRIYNNKNVQRAVPAVKSPALRGGLVMIAIGSIAAIELDVMQIKWAKILLSIGFALFFMWVARFHVNHILKRYTKRE